MKTLIFILVSLSACKPSELKITDGANSHTGEVEVLLEPVGVIPNDDCQHIALGDKACNFRLSDQDGNTWDLYQHEGDVIVLDFSAVWCPPCQAAGMYSQSIHDAYPNAQMVTILIDGYTPGIEPTKEEIDQWVENHEITSAPILRGSRDKMLDPEAIEGYSLAGFPTYLYIDKEMKFYAGHTGFSDEYTRLKIEEAL